jgi:hypothetical protein
MSDPRDLGFNYGTGWGSAPKPPIYLLAIKLARRLGQDAVEKSAQAWALEMALRNVRLATTGVEKAVAVVELARQMEKLTPATA